MDSPSLNTISHLIGIGNYHQALIEMILQSHPTLIRLFPKLELEHAHVNSYEEINERNLERLEAYITKSRRDLILVSVIPLSMGLISFIVGLTGIFSLVRGNSQDQAFSIFIMLILIPGVPIFLLGLRTIARIWEPDKGLGLIEYINHHHLK